MNARVLFVLFCLALWWFGAGDEFLTQQAVR